MLLLLHRSRNKLEEAMLTPIQEQAVQLYAAGKDLRQVAGELDRSHEWVRKTLAKAGVAARGRGRESTERPVCVECGKDCGTPQAEYCSRECLHKHRYEAAMARLNVAMGVLREGGSFSAAAKKAGFSNGWHLWGRLYHFGLTTGLREPTESVGPDKPEKKKRQSKTKENSASDSTTTS